MEGRRVTHSGGNACFEAGRPRAEGMNLELLTVQLMLLHDLARLVSGSPPLDRPVVTRSKQQDSGAGSGRVPHQLSARRHTSRPWSTKYCNCRCRPADYVFSTPATDSERAGPARHSQSPRQNPQTHGADIVRAPSPNGQNACGGDVRRRRFLPSCSHVSLNRTLTADPIPTASSCRPFFENVSSGVAL